MMKSTSSAARNCLDPETPAMRFPRLKRAATYALPFLSVLFFVIAGEAILRLYHFLSWNISMLDGQPRQMGGLSPITLDAELGWRATEDYRFNGTGYSSDGKSYPVALSQDERGFRMFGNLSSRKPRILVIGDSFTQATGVSDNKTYYAVAKSLLGAEVFAYGGGGYGTLQEYMILDKYIDAIKPDLILWQFCTNDFINNSPELETASTINNNGMVRPYWVNHQIRYILPKSDVRDFRLFALKYCRLCYMVLNRLDRLKSAALIDTVETKTSIGKPAHAAFLQSLQVTGELMDRVKKRAGAVPIVIFLVGTGTPYGPEYEQGIKEISRREHLMLLDGIDDAVRFSERNGAVATRSDGAHWNELGHRVVGETIAADLKKACLVNLCRRVKRGSSHAPVQSTRHRSELAHVNHFATRLAHLRQLGRA